MEFFADGDADRANSQKRVLCLLEALVWCNRLYLQQHPETPLIYQSGIKYKVPAQFEQEQLPEVDKVRGYLKKKGAPDDVVRAFATLSDMCGGGEHFREIPRIIENGGGDCDNVASWRVAELREKGVDAKPFITWRQRPDGGYTYHVTVLLPDGSSEDPSLLLGMGGANRAADRAREEQKLGERTAEFISGLEETGMIDYALKQAFYQPRTGEPVELLGAVTRRHRVRRALTKLLGSVTSTQNFNQLQYTIPFQTDDAMYEDWSPTRPQGFYNSPYYPNLPSTPGGVPLFNTRMRDPDSDYFEDPFEARMDRFDGDGAHRSASRQRRALTKAMRRSGR
jgi:hypothetical protein